MAAATGADLLWRVRSNLRLPRVAVLADGSHLSVVYPSEKDRRHKPRTLQTVAIDSVHFTCTIYSGEAAVLCTLEQDQAAQHEGD